MFLLFCKRTQKCPFDFVGGIKSAAAVRWVRNLNLPGNHATNRGTIQVLSGLCFSFFIQRTCRVKKSNPAAEPHGSPQGCTVRPRKGTGKCSIGGGERGAGLFSVRLVYGFACSTNGTNEFLYYFIFVVVVLHQFRTHHLSREKEREGGYLPLTYF
jgi:hypothetical protein